MYNNRIFRNLNINNEINFLNNNYRNIFKKNNNTFMKSLHKNNPINYFNDMDDNINPNKFNFNNTMNNFYPKKKQRNFMININGNMINDFNNFHMKNINKNNYRMNNRTNFNIMNDLNISMNNLSIQGKLDLFLKPENSLPCKKVKISCTFKDKIKDILEKFRNLTHNYDDPLKLLYKGKYLNENLTVGECKLNHNDIIIVVFYTGLFGGSECLNKEINIKFIKVFGSTCELNYQGDLFGLLKLCLLKEISSKLNENKFETIPGIISCIMKILKNGYCYFKDPREEIKYVLKKMIDSNIINFSKFVDEKINSYEMKIIFNLLQKEDLQEMNDIKNRLSKYNRYIKLFDEQFEKARKESIFEFSIISLVIIEREDFKSFEREREKCPNRTETILFHGTNIEPIANILTGYFKQSIGKCWQFGKGVYFTDSLDYCWYYGNPGGNRENLNKIPKIDETFTLIASSIYYDSTRKKKSL